MNDDADDVISWHRHAYPSYLGDFFRYGMVRKVSYVGSLG